MHKQNARRNKIDFLVLSLLVLTLPFVGFVFWVVGSFFYPIPCVTFGVYCFIGLLYLLITTRTTKPNKLDVEVYRAQVVAHWRYPDDILWRNFSQKMMELPDPAIVCLALTIHFASFLASIVMWSIFPSFNYSYILHWRFCSEGFCRDDASLVWTCDMVNFLGCYLGSLQKKMH